MLDVLLALAEVAARRNYCRPQLTEDDEIYIRAGRHPVIEVTNERFIPNDAYANNSTDSASDHHRSKYGREIGLSQADCVDHATGADRFICSAAEARIAIVDRIFTRVGASDSLARGRSTFMVEMDETANILNTATSPQSGVAG
jgi:DNA mismatch repair protein MutS